jgi:hypothetical protein
VTAYRYRPGRYRRSSLLRGRRASQREKIIGLAAGFAIAAAAGTHAAAAHHATRVTTTDAVAKAAPAVIHAAPVTSGSQTAFWRALLADLGAPVTQANLAGLDAWRPHEQPWPSLAQWNPLDSILPMPGSWAFNTFDGNLHVQNYPTAAEGAEADALTLDGGNYPMIVAAFRSGSGICGGGFASEFGTWSGGGYEEVC